MTAGQIFAKRPGEGGGGGRNGGVEHDQRGQAVGLEIGTSVEAVPADPEETGADEGQRDCSAIGSRP